jgi:hypothetical protein
MALLAAVHRTANKRARLSRPAPRKRHRRVEIESGGPSRALQSVRGLTGVC